jgi:hypothetical protein
MHSSVTQCRQKSTRSAHNLLILHGMRLQDCIERDVKGAICPRAASTMIALRGKMPSNDACLSSEDGWVTKPRPSTEDPDGCGPCLLAKEHETCHDVRNPVRHRGERAGGPSARHGHSSVLYQTPKNSDYGGATVMIVFGGQVYVCMYIGIHTHTCYRESERERDTHRHT